MGEREGVPGSIVAKLRAVCLALPETREEQAWVGWFTDIVGIVIEPTTSWSEIAELLTESYCNLAPQKLVDLVERPSG